jgi:hypothetical protein
MCLRPLTLTLTLKLCNNMIGEKMIKALKALEIISKNFILICDEDEEIVFVFLQIMISMTSEKINLTVDGI